MNRLGLTLTGIGVLVILLAGTLWYLWFRTPDTAPEPVENTEETAQDTTFKEEGDYYKVTATYPSRVVLGNVDAGLFAQATIEAFIHKEIATFKEENGVLSFTEEDVEAQRLSQRKYELEISYVTYESETTKSFVFVSYADTLGAHPNAYYRTFTFDTETGNALTLKNLFTDANYLETLSSLTRERLVEDMSLLQQVPPEEIDTTLIDVGTEPLEANFAWFFLQSETLSILFPPYQAGPWALGTQTVNLLTKDLPGLKEEYK